MSRNREFPRISGEAVLHDMKNLAARIVRNDKGTEEEIQAFAESARRLFVAAGSICGQAESAGLLPHGTSAALDVLLDPHTKIIRGILDSSAENLPFALTQLADFLGSEYNKKGLLYDVVYEELLDLITPSGLRISPVRKALRKVVQALVPSDLLSTAHLTWRPAEDNGKELCVSFPKKHGAGESISGTGIVVRPEWLAPGRPSSLLVK